MAVTKSLADKLNKKYGTPIPGASDSGVATAKTATAAKAPSIWDQAKAAPKQVVDMAVANVKQAAPTVKKVVTTAAKNLPAAEAQAKLNRIPALKDELRTVDFGAREALRKSAVPTKDGKFMLPSVDDPYLSQFEGLEFTMSEWAQNYSAASTGGTSMRAASPAEKGGPVIADGAAPQDTYSKEFITYVERQKNADARRAQTQAAEKAAGVDYLTKLKLLAPDKDPYVPFAWDNPVSYISSLERTAKAAQKSWDSNVMAVGRGFVAMGEMAIGNAEANNGSDIYRRYAREVLAKMNDDFGVDRLKRPDLNSFDTQKGFLEGGYADPAYYAETIAGTIPHIAGQMGAALLGAIATGGNPAGAVAGTVGYSYGVSSGDIYNEVIARGGDLEQARFGATYGGAAIAALDTIVPGKIAGRVLSDSAKNILKQQAKQIVKNQVVRSAIKVGANVAEEGLTEMGQEFVNNVVLSWYDSTQSLWENLPDAMVGGLIGGGFFSGAEGGINAMRGKKPVQNTGASTSTPPTGQDMSEETVPAGNSPDISPVDETIPNADVESNEPMSLATEITQLYENARAEEAAIIMGEKLLAQEENPAIAKIVAESRSKLLEFNQTAKILLNQQVTQEAQPVVNTENVTLKVGQLPDGTFVASGEIRIDGHTVTIPFDIDNATVLRGDAIAAATEKMNGWFTDTIAKNGIQDPAQTDVVFNTLMGINEDMTGSAEFVSANQEAVLTAQDSDTVEDFERTMSERGLSDSLDLKKIYARARDADSVYLTKQEARQVAEDLAGDLGVDVKFVDEIATNKRALGRFVQQVYGGQIQPGGTIEMRSDGDRTQLGERNIKMSTPYHEAAHAYFRNLLAPEEQGRILDTVREKYKNDKMSDNDAEEKLVEDLKDFVLKKKKSETKYGKVLANLVELAKKLVAWLGTDPQGKMDNFYRDVLGKKRPSERKAAMIARQKQELSDVRTEYFQEPTRLTSKYLKFKEIAGKEFVSFQQAMNAVKGAGLKQAEVDIITAVLETQFADQKKISVAALTDAIIGELLPLEVKDSMKYADYGLDNVQMSGWDGTTHIYDGPVEHDIAGHFGGETTKLFGHTRIAQKGNVRAVTEVQSDFFQKTRGEAGIEVYKTNVESKIRQLETELRIISTYKKLPYEEVNALEGMSDLFETFTDKNNWYKDLYDFKKKEIDRLSDALSENIILDKNKQRLAPYANIWHERMIKEEIRLAAMDGVKTLRVPTPKTIATIEGYQVDGTDVPYEHAYFGDTLTVGNSILIDGDDYVVVKAGEREISVIPRMGMMDPTTVKDKSVGVVIDMDGEDVYFPGWVLQNAETLMQPYVYATREVFDLDALSPSERAVTDFYKNKVGSYFKKLRKDNVREVTDENGLTWLETDITKQDAQAVEAFQTEEAAPPVPYIGVHGTTLEKLKATVELGGFPMPSIAVLPVTDSFDKYGDIRIVFKKDVYDPELGASLYDRDAYTPVSVTPEYKLNTKDAQSALEKAAEKTPQEYKDLAPRYYSYFPNEYSVDLSSPLSLANDVKRGHALNIAMAYIGNQGIEITIPKKKDGSVDEYGLSREVKTLLANDAGVADWVIEKFSPAFGSPFITQGRSKVPYNVENVVTSMKKMSAVGSGHNSFVSMNLNKARAANAQKIKTLVSAKAIKTMPYELAYDTLSVLHDAINDYAFGIEYTGTEYGFSKGEEFFEGVKKYYSGALTLPRLESVLTSKGFSPTETELVDLHSKLNEFFELPDEYLEAKPRGIVSFDQISGVFTSSDNIDTVKRLLPGVSVFDEATTRIQDVIAQGEVEAFQEVEIPDTQKKLNAMKMTGYKSFPMDEQERYMAVAKKVIDAVDTTTIGGGDDLDTLYRGLEATELGYKYDAYLLRQYGIGLDDATLVNLDKLQDNTERLLMMNVQTREFDIVPYADQVRIARDILDVAPAVTQVVKKATGRMGSTLADVFGNGYRDIEVVASKFARDGDITEKQRDAVKKFGELYESLRELDTTENDDTADIYMDKIMGLVSDAIVDNRVQKSRLVDAAAKLEDYSVKVSKNVAEAQQLRARLADMRILKAEREEMRLRTKMERNTKRRIHENIMKNGEVEPTIEMTQGDVYRTEAKAADQAAKATKKEMREQYMLAKKRRELIEKVQDVRSKYKKAFKEGKLLDLAYGRALMELFDTFQDSRVSQATVDKLNALLDLKKAGIGAEIGKKIDPAGEDNVNNIYTKEDAQADEETIARIQKRLTQKAIADMTTEELNELYNAIDRVITEGRFAFQVGKYMTEEQRKARVDKVVAGTKKIDDTVVTRLWEKIWGPQAGDNIRNARQNKLDYFAAQAVVDALDGSQFGRGVNTEMNMGLSEAEYGYSGEKNRFADDFMARYLALGLPKRLTKQEQAFTTLVMRMREGEDFVAQLVLDQYFNGEMPLGAGRLTMNDANALVDLMLDIRDEYSITNRQAAAWEMRTNKPFPLMDVYVAKSAFENPPTDWMAADELGITVMQTFGRNGSGVSDKFSLRRAAQDTALVPRVDSINLFLETVDHALWYVHMQPAIDVVQGVVSTNAYRDAAGRIGQAWFKEHLMLLAQRGVKVGSRKFAWVDTLRGNVTKSLLSFKGTTIMAQATQPITAAIVALPLVGIEASGRIMYEAMKSLAPGYVKNAAKDVDSIVTRIGTAGSYEVADVRSIMRRDSNRTRNVVRDVFDKTVELGMWTMQRLDAGFFTASRKAVYDTLISQGVDEELANKTANYTAEISNSSALLSNKPHVFSDGSFTRAFLMLQSFVIGWFSLMTVITKSTIKSGSAKQKAYGMVAMLAAPLAQSLWMSLIGQIFRGEEPEEENPLLLIAQEYAYAMPLVGGYLRSGMEFGKTDSIGSAAFSTVLKTAFGVADMVKADTDEKAYKAFLRAMEGGLSLGGIPGVAQGFDLLAPLLEGATDKKKRTVKDVGGALTFGSASDTDLDTAVREVLAKTYGDTLYELPAEERKKQESSIREGVVKAMAAKSKTPFAADIAKKTKNADKAALLLEASRSLPASEFSSLVFNLKKYKLLSDKGYDEYIKLRAK